MSEDCRGSNDICFEHTCIPIGCNSNEDCPSPYFCKSGACHQCHNINEHLTEDSTCSEFACVYGKCPFPYICRNGKCAICQGNDDCPLGTKCKRTSGSISTCREPKALCSYDINCPSKDKCIDGSCHSVCKEINDCSYSESCEEMSGSFSVCVQRCTKRCNRASEQCKINGCFTPECNRDEECRGNDYCSGGFCIPFVECKSDNDCSEGLNCFNNVCSFEESCNKENICSYGKSCFKTTESRVCLPNEVQCELDWDCPEMMHCKNKLCQPLPCSLNLHCKNYGSKLRMCKKGVCVPGCSGVTCKECDTNEDCSGKLKCLDNICKVREGEVQPLQLDQNIFKSGTSHQKVVN